VISASTGPARSVDPRVRERWIAARRADGRRRLRILLVGVALTLVGTIAWVVLASPLLDVHRIVVRGAGHTSRSQVVAAAQVEQGDAMVWVDAGAAADRVDALPWIRHARVERDWPGTVRITVTERTAVGYVVSPVGPMLVDGTGRVLERAASTPADLPELRDVKRVPPIGATITPVVGAHVADALVGYARSGTRTVDVGPGGVSLALVSGVEVRLGRPTAVMTKVRAAVAVLGALDGETVNYVDVTVPSNPVAG
jgi:cell division protein FtsQ